MKTLHLFVALAVLGFAMPAALGGTHWDLQAVDADGVGTWTGSATVTGIILNDPAAMLDPTANFLPWDSGANMFRLGGQWQLFVQSADVRDHAGTACWMGQNYGNMPWLHNDLLSYTNAEWQAELDRLNHDPTTGRAFQVGDLVQVTANNTGFYGGKTNINEGHNKSSAFDLSIELIEADYGLPMPELVTLGMLVAPDDGDDATHEDHFDATRLSGGEYFQGRRIRINDVSLSDAAGWGAEAWDDRLCAITDGSGRILPLRLPRGSVGGLGPAPGGAFDVIGIVNQESGSGSDGTYGYELYATEIVSVPEPGCLAFLGAGAAALLRRRKR
ncbi:MAG: hypothetical protein KGY99_01925 [Phycisphaerae bacterium]|nr:hypothetical protein [Phycisphaerae bacterium]